MESPIHFFAIPVIAVKDMMASYLSLIIAHGICDEVEPFGSVTAAGHSHLKSLSAAESNSALIFRQTWATFLNGEKRQ